MKKKQTIEHIVDWLSKYCNESGNDGFVVGVSGGIDSALTAALCARTGRKTILINLPIRQNPAEINRGKDLMKMLQQSFRNVKLAEVNLTGIFEKIESDFPSEIQDALTMANTRSRLRMTTLYAFAGHHKLLVAGTGNKIEDFGIGFFTKYGDGGVDLSPIADLLKSEVYALAAELNVPDSILHAAPTDGLFHDARSDEEQIGASYDELEWAMNIIETKDTNIEFTERQKIVLEIYKSRNKANRHKMLAVPVCIIPYHLKLD